MATKPDSTNPSAGDPPEPAAPEPDAARAHAIAKRLAFERLHRDYLAARAAFDDPDGPADGEARERLDDAHGAAQMALLMTPAPLPFCVWHKWEVLERLMTVDAESGQDIRNPAIVALASLKADVLRFGLKSPGD